MSKRLRAKLSEIKGELQRRRHRPLGAQGEWLRAVLRGHYRYYGVPTDIHAMTQFRTELARGWYRWLRRRSQERRLTWARMSKHVNRWLPPAHICHPWPWERFDVRNRDKSRLQ